MSGFLILFHREPRFSSGLALLTLQTRYLLGVRRSAFAFL